MKNSNMTFKFYGLDATNNFLQAPICGCGCGEYANLILETDSDVCGFMHVMLEEHDCDHCGILRSSRMVKMH